MITKTQSFQTEDGTIHATIELAQQHELVKLLDGTSIYAGTEQGEAIAGVLMKHKDAIVDCLTMKASSHPRARKVNGGKKAKRVAAPDKNQTALPV